MRVAQMPAAARRDRLLTYATTDTLFLNAAAFAAAAYNETNSLQLRGR